MISCKFASEYFNEENQLLIYNCPEQDKRLILESGFCIFHDKHFLDKEENRKKIVEEFQKKIDGYLSTKCHKPLFCIGYQLYDTDILDKEFFNSVYFNDANISGSLSINSRFHSHVSFTRAQFSGPGTISFLHSEFSGGNVIFSNAKFSGVRSVIFDSAQFSGPDNVFFNGTQFSEVEGNISFRNIYFQVKRNVSFRDAQFSGKEDVSFVDAKFSGEGNIGFSRAEFSVEGDVDFSRAEFSVEGDVDFGNVNFSGKGRVLFRDIKFLKEGNVSFTGAEFSGKGDVIFNNAEFSGKGDVIFVDAKFMKEGDVYFEGVEFSGEGTVSFGSAKFSGKGYVSFADSEFSGIGYVIFFAVNFMNQGDISFSGTTFSKSGFVDFSAAKFFGATYFLDCAFECNVYFTLVTFMSPNEVRFGTADLSNVSFLGADITRILFHENAHFGKLESKEEEFKILDERLFVKSMSKGKDTTKDLEIKPQGLEIKQLGNIQASYRNLRENYEYRLRYDEAGQFFVREMDLKRKYREKLSTSEERYITIENNWFRRNFSFIGLYHNVCKYGESSTRPLILFAIIMSLSSVFWFVSSSLEPSIKDLVTSNCNEPILLCSVERTLKDIVSFPEKGIIVDYLTRISSILVLATLFLPFRRKFERRFRH